MRRVELEIPGNPCVVLARVASTLLAWLGPKRCVLGGETRLAARWQHRVTTDIDLLTDHDQFTERVASRRQEVADALEALVADGGDAYVEFVWGADIPTESTAEILARSPASSVGIPHGRRTSCHRERTPCAAGPLVERRTRPRASLPRPARRPRAPSPTSVRARPVSMSRDQRREP